MSVNQVLIGMNKYFLNVMLILQVWFPSLYHLARNMMTMRNRLFLQVSSC